MERCMILQLGFIVQHYQSVRCCFKRFIFFHSSLAVICRCLLIYHWRMGSFIWWIVAILVNSLDGVGSVNWFPVSWRNYPLKANNVEWNSLLRHSMSNEECFRVKDIQLQHSILKKTERRIGSQFDCVFFLIYMKRMRSHDAFQQH